jgi:DNA-binding response OmpR family regulator
MIEAQESTSSAESRLSRARAEFVSTLGRRLTALANTLHQLEENPANRERRNMLLRRVHALGSAAKVLGFDGVAEALSEAERALARSAAGGPVSSTDLAEVSRALDLLPSIAWGAKVSPRATEEPEGDLGLVALGWPLSILVYGPAVLRASLMTQEDDQQVECEVAEDSDAFRELAQRIGPDLAVIDADLKGAKELLENLAHDPLVEPFPVIVVGTFDSPEAASGYVSLGAVRVLPKPVSPEALARAVIEASEQDTGPRGPREPIGDVTVDELAARMAAELRRGLVDAVERGGESVSIPLGEGIDVLAAVWGSVARVREVLTMRSGGRVRFRAGGPEGAVPLAPWTSPDRRAGERGAGARRTDGVRLEGRRAVVVDDDPAVVWFLSGLLKTSGVEVAEAHDGTRARELVLEGMPDLVVSDVLMPGIDGFTLCREIKRDLAVRDVPVILLSWKEDLLQRVRELGAGADGYLRKEAQASTVLQRVREVLRPRARVETRLQTGGEVRGRLDGLTPRLLLELVSRHQPDSRVVVRDAVFLYELEMRSGRPRCVTRTATDGSFERGPRVLDALVGVTAGRFVVTPSSSGCRDELSGELSELLSPRIRRARAVLDVVSERELGHVDFVEIDVDSVAAYAHATPEPARSLLQALLNGVAPRQLLEQDPSCQSLLSAVLADVARRGAVRSVLKDGQEVDLEAVALPPEPVPGEPEAPLFTLELSAAPPEVSESLARWEKSEPSDPSVHLPLSRAMTPVPPEPSVPMPEPSQGFREEPHTAPGVGPVVLDPPVQGLGAQPTPPPVPTNPEPSDSAPEGASPVPSVPEAPETSAKPAAAEAKAVVPPSEAPTATPPPAGESPPWKTVEAGVELPSGAFPTSGDEAHHDSTPLTLRAETPEVATSEARSEAVDEDEASAEPEKNEEESKPGDDKEMDAALPRAKKIEFPPSARSRARAASAETEKSAVPAPLGKAEPRPSRPAPSQGMSGTRIVAYIVGSAVLSFGVVTAIRSFTGGGEQPAEPAAAAVAPAAPTVPAPTPKPVQKAKVEPKTEDLGLPPGVPLSNDKGLLEIDIGEKHAIYVDGTFVGRGPMRRVPLGAGSHEVVLKTPEGDISLQASVTVGRRMRVSLPPPAQ